jgi:hypothetical protein
MTEDPVNIRDFRHETSPGQGMNWKLKGYQIDIFGSRPPLKAGHLYQIITIASNKNPFVKSFLKAKGLKRRTAFNLVTYDYDAGEFS